MLIEMAIKVGDRGQLRDGQLLGWKHPGGYLSPSAYLNYFNSKSVAVPSAFRSSPMNPRNRAVETIRKDRIWLSAATDDELARRKFRTDSPSADQIRVINEKRARRQASHDLRCQYGYDSVWGHHTLYAECILIVDVDPVWLYDRQCPPVMYDDDDPIRDLDIYCPDMTIRIPYETLMSGQSLERTRTPGEFVEVPRHRTPFQDIAYENIASRTSAISRRHTE